MPPPTNSAVCSAIPRYPGRRDGKIIKRITGIISYEEIAKAIESQL